jgi:Ca2+-binding EF-hand superfamily protein
MLILLVCPILVIGCDTQGGTGTEDTIVTQEQAAGNTDQPDAQTEPQPYGETDPGDTATQPTQMQQQGGTAAQFGTYQEWDADQSGAVTQTEFASRFQSFAGWSQWDADRDQNLDETEAAQVQWTMFDGNADGRLDETEWREGVEELGVAGDYEDSDRDGDGRITQAEFTQWFERNAWSVWDRNGDGMVGRDEAADTLWNMWDGDDDDQLEENEWREAVQV